MAARASHLSCARRFLRNSAGPAGKKLYRKSAYWMLLAINKMLVLATDMGLEQFTLAEDTADGASSKFEFPRRLLSIAADQCSVGLSACTFLLSLPVAVNFNMDMPHRFHNNDLGGLRAAGCWEIVLLLRLVWNVHYGPFKSGAWLLKLRESMAEYGSSVCSDDCPLFRRFAWFVARERNETDHAHNQEWLCELWEEFTNASLLRNKGPHMAVCRWFSACDCFRYWRGLRWLRAVLLLYVGA